MKGTALAVGLLVATAACGANKALAPGSGGASGGAAGNGGGAGGAGGSTTFPIDLVVNRNLDVLFMIDDSSGMVVHQAKLAASISAYFDVLKNLPGGLPNVHVGIVSSSMGAGRNPSIDHCPPGGGPTGGGLLQATPRGSASCTRASLDAGQSFIIDVNGHANYTGDIADMFSCIALLGSGGCGFEHQLASVMRALGVDGAPAPAQNANFLRPDAYLQIVLLTDEDDCSAPPDSDLFDSSSMTIADPLGPLQSYRCNEFGHLCGGKPPPRQPPGEVDLSGTCVSNEGGRLIKIADVVTALRRLKANPSKVFVAALTGPTSPYKVNVGPSQIKGDPSMWPYVEHSCVQSETDGSQTYSDPAIRIAQFINGFGANGALESLCAPTYAPALQAIASQIGSALGVPCFPANVSPDECQFVDTRTDINGDVTNVPLARCQDASDAGPCWDVGPSTPACAQPIVVRHPEPPVGVQVYTTGTCTPPRR
jgi:hypothetical protein